MVRKVFLIKFGRFAATHLLFKCDIYFFSESSKKFRVLEDYELGCFRFKEDVYIIVQRHGLRA